MDKIRIFFWIVIFSLSSCGLLVERSPEKLYKEFMNMDVPNELRNFIGEGEIVFPEFMSKGYFIYEANEDYFELLSNFNNFTEKYINNHPFIERPPAYYELNSIYLRCWTKDTKLEKNISLKHKRIYEGINFPWKHYLLRDTLTNKTYHLVGGIRR